MLIATIAVHFAA